MIACKRCGSDKIVKSGKVRGEQRYMCKRCGYNFVVGDKREKNDREKATDAVLRAICVIFRALGVKQHKKMGEYLRRDTSQIFKWMEEDGISTWCSRRASPLADKDEFIESMKDRLSDDAVIAAEGTYEGLYIALAVQRQNKR